MTEQEREKELQKVSEWVHEREERERKAKEYRDEYYRKLRSGEHKIQYTDEYLQKESEKEREWAERKTAHPDTMEKTPATILLIAGIVVSFMFKQWYLLWIMLFWWYFSKDRV